MNEEAVKLGSKQLQQGLTYDQVVYLFVEQTSGVVKDTVQIFKHEFDAVEQSKLPKMEDELHYFLLFALDYWWQMSSYTQKQKRILDEVFGYHLGEWCGNDADGQAMWDTLQERFIAYGGIVNKKTDDSVKLFDFGRKLSDYCGLPSALFLVTAPSLFKTALDTVSVLKADKRGLQ